MSQYYSLLYIVVCVVLACYTKINKFITLLHSFWKSTILTLQTLYKQCIPLDYIWAVKLQDWVQFIINCFYVVFTRIILEFAFWSPSCWSNSWILKIRCLEALILCGMFLEFDFEFLINLKINFSKGFLFVIEIKSSFIQK